MVDEHLALRVVRPIRGVDTQLGADRSDGLESCTVGVHPPPLVNATLKLDNALIGQVVAVSVAETRHEAMKSVAGLQSDVVSKVILRDGVKGGTHAAAPSSN